MPQKKPRPSVGPVAFWIHDLTNEWPSEYRHERHGAFGTYRGREYQVWYGNDTVYAYVDGSRVSAPDRLPTHYQSWTKGKQTAWNIVQHVDNIEMIERRAAA